MTHFSRHRCSPDLSAVTIAARSATLGESPDLERETAAAARFPRHILSLALQRGGVTDDGEKNVKSRADSILSVAGESGLQTVFWDEILRSLISLASRALCVIIIAE